MTSLNKSQVRTAFASAAQTYQQAAIVQNEIIDRLLEKLLFLKTDPSRILDLGCGPGNILVRLLEKLPNTEYLGVDFAFSMLAQASEETNRRRVNWLCADIEALPVADNSCDVVLSASTLQWSEAVDKVFRDCHRVLNDHGLFIFSTFGPDTLHELKGAFLHVDPQGRHINHFEDMHTLGDCLYSCGFMDVVMEVDRIQVMYSDPLQLMRDLRVTGANNHLSRRTKGLFGVRKMRAVMDAYRNKYSQNGQYPATYEVIYGVGKVPSGAKQNKASHQEGVPINFYSVKP